MGRFYLSEQSTGHLLDTTLYYWQDNSRNWTSYIYLDLTDTPENRIVAEDWRDSIFEAIARVHRINPNQFTDYKQPFNPKNIKH